MYVLHCHIVCRFKDWLRPYTVPLTHMVRGTDVCVHTVTVFAGSKRVKAPHCAAYRHGEGKRWYVFTLSHCLQVQRMVEALHCSTHRHGQRNRCMCPHCHSVCRFRKGQCPTLCHLLTWSGEQMYVFTLSHCLQVQRMF